MRLSVLGLAMTFGLLWGGALLIVGLVATNLGVTDGAYYGKDFLLMVASVYPGYTGTPGTANSLIGAGYGLVDGFIGGIIFAWLYNCFAGGKSSS